MDSETPVLKWTAIAVGVIILFFCIGFFVVGRLPIGGASSQNQVAVAPAGDSAVAVPSVPVVAASSGATMTVDERTDDIEAKQKAEAAAKAKADAEAKKKADAAATVKAQEDAAAAAAANNATPAPDTAVPTDVAPPASPAPTADNTVTTAATPAPVADATPAPPPADTIYRVRVGSFATRDSAKAMATELNGRGYAAMVVPGGGGFRLQVGAYKDKKTAEGIQQELKANGYDSSVSN